MFVGMTRAIHRLVLTRAERRPWRGRMQARSPSRFIAEIGEDNLERIRPSCPGSARRKRQLSLF